MKAQKIALCALALVFAIHAHSFKIDFYTQTNTPIHENITVIALDGITVILNDGSTAEFNENAAINIKEANTGNDEEGIENGYMHFDDSRINESSKYARSAIIQAINMLPKISGIGSEAETYNIAIQYKIGTAFHTLQDFFAHSTWVETNDYLDAFSVKGLDMGGHLRTDSKFYVPIPPIGIRENPFDLSQESEISKHALGISVFNDEGGTSGKSTNTLGGCHTTSGRSEGYSPDRMQISTAYYDFNMSYIKLGHQLSYEELGTATNWWNGTTPTKLVAKARRKEFDDGRTINWPEQFCTHGDDAFGINKDHERRSGHRKAYNAAIMATRNLALHFLSFALSSSDGADATVCGYPTFLKCTSRPFYKFDDYLIDSVYPSAIDDAPRNGKKSFRFHVDQIIAASGLLQVTYNGNICHIYDDYKDTSTKNFFCDSDLKGPGKLKIYQTALPSKALYESDTFVITCEKGVRLANGSCVDLESSGNALVSGETLTATVVGLTNIVSQIEWWFDTTKQAVTSRTVGMISDAQQWIVKELGTHTVTAILKAATDDVLATLESTFSVTPKVMSISQMTPLETIAGSSYEFAFLGENIPEDGRINFDFPQCSGMLKVNHTDSRVDYSCTLSTSGTFVVVVKDEANEKEIAQFTVVVKPSVTDLNAALFEPFDGTALNPERWTTRGGASCGDHQVTSGKATFFGGAYADTQDKKTFTGKKIVIEAIMGGTQGNRDTHFELVDVASGQTIQMGDTSDNTTAASGLYLSTNPGSEKNDFDQRGIEATSAKLQAYRLTLHGQSATLERGDSFTGAMSEHTFTLPRSIAGKTFYLRVGTGAADCVYSPGTFDSIKVTTFTEVFSVNPANGHFYEVIECGTWTQCQQLARSRGGELATIRSSTENQWLAENMVRPFQNNGWGVWIGLTDEGHEGVWTWSSGEPLAYINWGPSNPSNSGGIENYVHMGYAPGLSSTWNDRTNDANREITQAIVEYVPR